MEKTVFLNNEKQPATSKEDEAKAQVLGFASTVEMLSHQAWIEGNQKRFADEKAFQSSKAAQERRQAANVPDSTWVRPESGQETMQTVVRLLEVADAVTVDDGAVLTTWDSSPISGDPENQIAHFSWCDEDHNFGCSLDEAGVAGGSFAEDGTFSCTDTEGEPVTLKFYELKVLQQRAQPN